MIIVDSHVPFKAYAVSERSGLANHVIMVCRLFAELAVVLVKAPT